MKKEVIFTFLVFVISISGIVIAANHTNKDLVWYLEIDIGSHNISECKLKYDTKDNEFKIKVKEDMTLEGNAGSCLDISYGGYWFKINEKCFDTEFEISCDKDFVTTLVYQKRGGDSVYVSSNTHSSTSLGTTKERVNAKAGLPEIGNSNVDDNIDGNVRDDKEKLCESEGYYCEGNDACLNAEGNVLSEFKCTNFREICCSVKVVEPTCEEKKGIICTENQECDAGRIEVASDGRCCVGGGCINKKVENVCETARGSCRSSCFDSEEKSDESCLDEGDVCCFEKEKPKTPERGRSYLWIIILSIFIVLVIIALIYRRKIQIWWYSRRAGRGAPPRSGAGPIGRPPGFMPLQQPRMRPMMPRYGPPGQRGPVRGGPVLRTTKGVKSEEEKDMEETMRKLKEMSK